jgi:hypothetical protein
MDIAWFPINTKRIHHLQVSKNMLLRIKSCLKIIHLHGCLLRNFTPGEEWVKRQRYQYKLKNEGKHSTMSDDRIAALEMLGYVWNSHDAVWEERWKELWEYKEANNNCNVPSNYPENPQLAIWIKRQRRQYKFYCNGDSSTMTPHRIQKLEELEFAWNGRNPQNRTRPI